MRNFPDEMEKIKTLASVDFLDLCLLGETGTGKTYIAQLIHNLSPRSKQPFIAVNCAELTPTLIEAELFGYERGAFTGAIARKAGFFEAAAGGTLFLDEIGEFPAALQGKLLKAVEEKCITRIGGNRPRPVNVRIIYATNRSLEVFREDLRYRIAAHTIKLKPLRERKDEIVALARLFFVQFSHRLGRDILVSNESLKILEKADWQGNIRELRSFVEKLCLGALFDNKNGENEGQTIEITREQILTQVSRVSVPDDGLNSDRFGAFASGDKLENYLKRIETYLLKNAMENHNNNQTRAAQELGISRTGLIKKLKRIEH